MSVMREVNVRPVLNGFIVNVGCQTLVFNRIEDVAENLIAYQKDPDGVEEKFVKEAVNSTMAAPEPVNRRVERVRLQEALDTNGQENCGTTTGSW